MTAEELAAVLQDPDVRRVWEEATELAGKAAGYDAALARAEEVEAELDEFASLWERWEAANETRKAQQLGLIGQLKDVLNKIEEQTGRLQAERDVLAQRIGLAVRLATVHLEVHPRLLPGTCPACALIVALELSEPPKT